MKKISTIILKQYDLLRGNFDSPTSLRLIKELAFLYLLDKELAKKNKLFTSQLQGQLNLQEVTTNEELMFSLRSFLNQNPVLDWVEDMFPDLIRLQNQEVFEKMINNLKEIPVESSSIEIFFECLDTLNTKDRYQLETSKSLCLLSKALLSNTSYETLYDPAIGVGKLAYEVSLNHPNVKIYGQEIDRFDLTICRMLLALSGRIHELSSLKEGHTITDPKHRSGNQLQTFDCVVCQPPFGLRDWGMEQVMGDARFHRGIPPRTGGEYAFITQVVESLNEHGKGVMILPSGPLFREAREGEIRKKLIEENLIEAVISLPGNMLHNSAIPVNIVIFSKRKQNSNIFFIDATSFTTRQRTLSTLTEIAIQEISKLYHNFEEREEISRLVSLSDIQDNRYNLMVERYVTSKTVQEVFDLESLQQEHQNLMKHLETIQTQLEDILA